ncbi:hypothetical protein NLJ89_g1745 [Agrocybe chaxingu]|uniref:Elongation factor EFG domain-containing protein n=1 Tax=Agrocybe chaxingu TaxID=84603 RepID=A0A9W8MZG8_9AGAR|nr:hypothetical protein NLJ89_g1745 [Agrocybe chaxingu]
MLLPKCRLAGIQGIARRLKYRRYATASSHDPSKFRNIALVAHIDSGKTTLTESILLKSSYISSSGTVDTGSTTTDFLPVERERGITVRYGVNSRIMFLNKLDRPGASFRASLRSLLKHRLHHNPMALTLPIASFNPKNYAEGEPGVQGLVDLVRWNVWKWDDEGRPSCHALPKNVDHLQDMDTLPSSHPIVPHLVPARTQLLENLSMVSENFMEYLLNLPSDPSAYLKIDGKTVMKELRRASIQNRILPVLCGSAMKHIGTDLVMDYVGELLPSPLDVEHEVHGKNPPVRLLAWKVNWDERKGWMTFVRVYSGKDPLRLKYTRTGDTLVSSNASDNFRSSLRDITPPPAVMSASVIPQSRSDLEPVQDALDALVRTDPSVRVETQEGQMLVHGLGALHLEIVEGRLRDEWKASFEFGRRRVSYRESLGLKAPSAGWDVWETEIAGKALSIRVPLSVRKMGPEEKGDPVWDGNIVVDEKNRPIPAPESMPGSQLAYVADGILNSLSNSPHSSLPLTHLHIKVGNLKTIDSKVPSIVTGATAAVLRKRIRDAAMGPLLEPFVFLKISVSESNVGKVVKDLTEHGGEVLDLGDGVVVNLGGAEEIDGYSEEGIYVPPDWLSPSGTSTSDSRHSGSHLRRSVQGVAPLSQFLDYSNRLRSLSEGHGVFEMSSAGFREVAEDRKMEILKEIGRA